MRRLLLASIGIGLATACGGAPRARVMSAVEAHDVGAALDAYERFRQTEGADGDLLAHVAALVLEEAILGDDATRADAALGELAMAGTAGDDTVRRLAVEGRPDAIRARALALLAKRGDGGAKDELRAYVDSDDWVVKAAAVEALSVDEDGALLIALLGHPAAGVRRAAAALLARAVTSGEALAALSEQARVDPEPAVRAACVRALGEHGPAGFETLRERLSDPDSQVRMSAVTALVRADRERALSALGPLLEMAPSPAGVEAARVLAGGARRAGEETPGADAEGVTLARAYLRRSLESAEPALRSQAAVALSSLPEENGLDAALREALDREQEPSVQISLAIILAAKDASRARALEVLAALMERDGVQAVHAAGVLAKHGETAAIDRLGELLHAPTPDIRRVAARALAREAMQPDAARTALRDEDPLVRIRAAGGILAAASAS
jgi:HEAT repeat protein